MIPLWVMTCDELENAAFIFPSSHAIDMTYPGTTTSSFLTKGAHSLVKTIEPQVKETPLPLAIEAFQVRAQRRLM
jgi:hypothetical protein